MAACYAVENSLGYQADPTTDARILRNLTLGVEFIMSHLAHFYALAALDYVQGPGNPFGGGIGAPAQSGPWTPDFNPSYYFNDGAGMTLDRTDTSGLWWEVIQDYTIALQLAKRAGDLMGILGGRWPMYSNLVCGGVTHPNLTGADLGAIDSLAKDYLYRGTSGAPDLEGGVQTGNGGTGVGPPPVGPDQGTVLHFIQQHYIPTVAAVAAVYSNYDNSGNTGIQLAGGGWLGATLGQDYGAGTGNFLSWGAFHLTDDGHTPGVGHIGSKADHPDHLLKTGVWLGGPGGGLEPGSENTTLPPSTLGYADPNGLAKACLKEFITSSKYDDGSPSYAGGLAPDQGYTKPNKSKAGAYSWIKSPRIVSDGTYVTTAGTHVCEVGPLARMVVSGLYDITGVGPNNFLDVNLAGPNFKVCSNRGVLAAVWGVLNGLTITQQNFGISAMDRHRARAVEALTIANAVPGLLGGLTGGATVDSSWTIPQSGTQEGWGTNEAPRGALLHYNKYSNNRIEKYQCVVPTTWNASPRDAGGQAGPIEAAVMNPAMAHSGNSSPSWRVGGTAKYVPVEALRVVHSFDPCIACAVHTVDRKKAKAKRVNNKKEVRRR